MRPSEDLLTGLAHELGRVLPLASVVLHTDDAEPVRWGRPQGLPTVLPLRYGGEHVGDLEVTVAAGDPLPPRGVLEEHASAVAVAVVVARTAGDADRLHDRLARARLEERELIRREVQDGLGPLLAGLRLGLQGARNLLGTHPEAGRELLTHLQDEVDRAVEGVHALTRLLVPPSAEGLDLVPALRELVRQYADGRPLVVLDAGPVDEVDPWTAAAAYAIAAEALSDALRHSVATGCRVGIRVGGRLLVLEVADDGRGVPVGAARGSSEAAIRERASEHGGRVQVSARPGGGTVVRVVLPLVGSAP